MPCFHPKTAFRTDNGEIVFAERGKIDKILMLPCGQCIGCRLERSRQWAIRCIHEAQMHEQNCFITLTYNDENIQHDLIYSHFQKFIRALRKKTGKKIRYYMAGEYGSETGRPHFHACLFGHDFKNKTPIKKLADNTFLYRSPELETLWPYGFSSIGAVTFESAAYVARYIMKKITGLNAEDRYWSVNPMTGEAVKITPEFNRMSLKPGIGQPWLDKYMSDIYPNGTCYIRNQKMKPPRFYEKKFAKLKPYDYEDLQYERYLKSDPTESHPDRLDVREQVTKSRIQTLSRKL
jgi:hypothetical protein